MALSYWILCEHDTFRVCSLKLILNIECELYNFVLTLGKHNSIDAQSPLRQKCRVMLQ